MARYGSALDEKMQQAEERNKNKKVQVKGPSGQLTSVTPSSLSQATELQTGGPSPVTPVGASQMGVGPDSAKMAGTQVQKDSSLKQAVTGVRPTIREAVDPSQQLSTAQRQQQGRAQARGGEQQVLEKSAALENLGGLGDRVYNLISDQFSQLQGSEVALEGAPEQIAAVFQDPNATPEQKNQVIQDWANQKIDAGEEVNFETMKQLFPNPQDAIAAAVAAGIEDQLVIDDSIVQELGFESLQDLEAQTGVAVPPGATLQDVQNIVEGEIAAEFDRTENLRQLMNDPNTSPQERAAARQELIDMGAIGLSAGEQSAHQIEQAVSEADEIQFGGETVSLENLMDDEFVSGLTKRFFEDPEYAAKIKEENPEFASFLETNQAALQDLTADLDESVTQITEAHTAQQELVNVGEGLQMDSEVIADVLGVNLDKYGEDTSALTDSTIYKALQGTQFPEANKKILLDSFNKIGKQDTELAKQIANMNPVEFEELRDSGAFDTGGVLEQLASYLNNPSAANPATAFAFSNIKTVEDILDAPAKMKSALVAESINNLGKMGMFTEEFSNKYGDLLSDGNLSSEDASQIGASDLGLLYRNAKGPVRGVIKEEFQNRQMEDLADLQANNAVLPIDSLEELDMWEMPEKPDFSAGVLASPTAETDYRNEIIARQKEVSKSLDKLLELKKKYPVDAYKDLGSLINALQSQQKDLESNLEYGPKKKEKKSAKELSEVKYSDIF